MLVARLALSGIAGNYSGHPLRTRCVLADAAGTARAVFIWSVNLCVAVAAISRFSAGAKLRSFLLRRDSRVASRIVSRIGQQGLLRIVASRWVTPAVCLIRCPCGLSPVSAGGSLFTAAGGVARLVSWGLAGAAAGSSPLNGGGTIECRRSRQPCTRGVRESAGHCRAADGEGQPRVRVALAMCVEPVRVAVCAIGWRGQPVRWVRRPSGPFPSVQAWCDLKAAKVRQLVGLRDVALLRFRRRGAQPGPDAQAQV